MPFGFAEERWDTEGLPTSIVAQAGADKVKTAFFGQFVQLSVVNMTEARTRAGPEISLLVSVTR